MEQQTLEDRLAKVEKEVKELHAALSIKLEYEGELHEMLVELLQILRRKQELSWERPRSALESSSSSFPKSKSEAMLERCVNLIFKDYEDQFRE
jgi:hypothetical protein